MIGETSGLSTTEELLRTLDVHVSGEAEHVAEYRELSRSAVDPVVAVLMDLVIRTKSVTTISCAA